MNYTERMEAILASDRARRAAREAAPDHLSDKARIAVAPPHSAANGCLVRPIGVVSPHKPRVSERWYDSVSSGYVGRAGAEVRVTKDGITTSVPATSFRKHSTTRAHKQRSTTATAHTPEAARIKLDHNFND